MFVYNITLKVDHSILHEWLQWQKEIYIPRIMATGFFYEYRFYQLLEQDETEGKTFVTQFISASKADYDKYFQKNDAQLSKEIFAKWNDRIVFFHTLLQDMQ